jgi:hypothetical protein
MSDEEDSDGEAGLPSWVCWMIGGLIVFAGGPEDRLLRGVGRPLN